MMDTVSAIRIGKETVGYLKTKAKEFKWSKHNREIFEERAEAVEFLQQYAVSKFTSNA
jgi:hypothetical protein